MRNPIGQLSSPQEEKGKHLHIDIFYAQNLKYFLAIDLYSKFCTISLLKRDSI